MKGNFKKWAQKSLCGQTTEARCFALGGGLVERCDPPLTLAKPGPGGPPPRSVGRRVHTPTLARGTRGLQVFLVQPIVTAPRRHRKRCPPQMASKPRNIPEKTLFVIHKSKTKAPPPVRSSASRIPKKPSFLSSFTSTQPGNLTRTTRLADHQAFHPAPNRALLNIIWPHAQTSRQTR